MTTQLPPGPPEWWRQPQPPAPAPMSDDERKAWLAQQVDSHLRAGWEVESQTAHVATLRRGHRINHLLHLILTLVTCGIWAVVWTGLAIFGGEKHKAISMRDADRPPQTQTYDRTKLFIFLGAVLAFVILVGILRSLFGN